MKVPVTRNVIQASPLSAMLLRKCTMIAFAVLVTLFSAIPVYAQNSIRVKGRVTGEGGTGVPNATVSVKGTSSSTISDDNGNFEIDAPDNGTLVISSAGYESREVAINRRQTINTELQLAELEQVVVVGYGTQKKRDVTGAVVSVSAQTLKEVPAPNLINQLKGRTAGVTIISNSATPGGAGQIRIRGNRSLAKSSGEADNLDNPLIVLDGIPFGGSINDINPEDIVSLEILKDASATAIYGSRGAGGVILITSKRGKTGKAVINYDGYIGTANPVGKLDAFTGPELAQFKADAARYNRTAPGSNSYGLTPAEQQALADGVSTDWQDLIYRNGMITNHHLGVSGGADKTQYGLGLGYFNEEGIIPNQNFERFTIRATLDQQIGKRIRIGLNSINNLSYTNTPGGGGVPSGLIRLSPLADAYNPDGTVNLFPQPGHIDAAAINPLTLKTKSDAILARNRRIRTFNSIYAEISIIDGLKYRLNVGLDFRQDNGGTYNGPGTFTNTNTNQVASNASISNGEAWTYTIEHLLMFDKTIKEKHRLSFTGLFSTQKDHNQSSGFSVLGVPANYILNSNFGLASGTINSNPNNTFFSERGLISYMARVNYAFDNRYLFTATVRRDGASTLSPGFQYYTYPAFSLGWNVLNESFMSNVAFFSNLKVRGGWGKTSNQGVPPYATLGLLTATAYNFGSTAGGQQEGYLVTTLANSALKWQSTSQWNVGLDFGLFNNRITGSVDVYKQQTEDILLDFNLPQSNGASTTRKNLGKTEGSGLEINLTTINIQSNSGFSWSTDWNFFFNREKIVQLQTPDRKEDIANGWFVGQPLTVIYDVKKIGIWQANTKDSTDAAGQNPRQYPGQIRVEDINGNNTIDAADRQIIGNFQPKWEGGMTHRFAYKNFDFSVVVFARMGMKVLLPYLTADGGAQGFPFFMQSRANQVKVNYWTHENPTNDFPAPDAGTDRPFYLSTMGYQDGSFIKCRSMNLGYQFTSKTLGRSGISSLRVYLNVTNPFIIYSPLVSDGLAVDPEGNGYGGAVGTPAFTGSVPQQGRQISVNANNPPLRQFILGVNVKF